MAGIGPEFESRRAHHKGDISVLLDAKRQRLRSIIGGYESAVIAFSGGVDSSLVCVVAYEILADNAVAITAVSETYPSSELEISRKLADRVGIKHLVISTDELQDSNFSKNPSERCYFCKKELLRKLDGIREELGFKHIFDGTNFDDYSDIRPGLRAVREFDVHSPLAEARLTKDEVRKLAASYGLSNADKPANPCLASRIPFGMNISLEKLDRINKGEEYVRSLGFNIVRVRDQDGLARVEVGIEEIPMAKKLEKDISLALCKIGYSSVAIDHQGYRMGGANI